jgi:Protein of unknown function (DUF4239)
MFALEGYRGRMQGILIAALIVGGAVIYALVGVHFGRRFTKLHVAEGHNDVLVPIFLTAGVIYAVLLGFMVVAVWESYEAAHDNAAEEAAMLVPLYRQTTVMAPEKGAVMRQLIREYAENVIHDEWPAMQKSGAASEKARKSVGDIFREYATLTPATKVREFIAAQFLSSFSQVVLDRNKRILQAGEALSWIIWLGVVGGGAIIVGMTFMLYMDKRMPQMIMTAVMSGMIGTLLFIMVVLNKPFVGPLALDPAPFEQSIAAFDDVDRGN